MMFSVSRLQVFHEIILVDMFDDLFCCNCFFYFSYVGQVGNRPVVFLYEFQVQNEAFEELLSGRPLIISMLYENMSTMMSLRLFLVLNTLSRMKTLKLSASSLFDLHWDNGRSWFLPNRLLQMLSTCLSLCLCSISFFLKMSFLSMIIDVWYFSSPSVEMKVFLSVLDILVPDFLKSPPLPDLCCNGVIEPWDFWFVWYKILL